MEILLLFHLVDGVFPAPLCHLQPELRGREQRNALKVLKKLPKYPSTRSLPRHMTLSPNSTRQIRIPAMDDLNEVSHLQGCRSFFLFLGVISKVALQLLILPFRPKHSIVRSLRLKSNNDDATAKWEFNKCFKLRKYIDVGCEEGMLCYGLFLHKFLKIKLKKLL
jgi:hypothetical protein